MPQLIAGQCRRRRPRQAVVLRSDDIEIASVADNVKAALAFEQPRVPEGKGSLLSPVPALIVGNKYFTYAAAFCTASVAGFLVIQAGATEIHGHNQPAVGRFYY
ncbi:hypothetical protein [Sodalis sp. C49]|uniref:hypothetical protein n=1 Tax=Sodalis sp. C49 TaxID=3228929 RepID=UPI003965BE79